MKKIILILIIVISLFINTACWDKYEIEDRAYFTAIGFDDIKNKENNKFKVTYEYPNLRAIGKNGQGQPRFIVTEKGDSISEINRKLGTIIENDIFFNHLKVIIIGEELAKDKVKLSQVFEIFNRTPVTGAKVTILITKGKAEDIINTKLRDDQILGNYIRQLEERKSIGGKYQISSMHKVFTDLYRSNIGLIGKIESGKDGVEIEGSTIIKDKRLVAFLEQKDTSSILILTEKIYNDEVVINKESGRYLVNYIVSEYKVKKDIKVENGNLKFIYDINSEGYIDEYLDSEGIETNSDLLSEKKIKKIEKQLNNEIKKKLNNTIDKLQNEIGVDAIQVEKYLRQKEPDLWEKVKDNWDNEFKKIDFTVKVDSKIRRIGLSE